MPGSRQLIPGADVPELDEISRHRAELFVTQNGETQTRLKFSGIALGVAFDLPERLQELADHTLAGDTGSRGIIQFRLPGAEQLELGKVGQDRRQLKKVFEL